MLAIGDGANDLPMMSEAGTSIAYHAKPVVKAKATYALDYAGLDGVLAATFCPVDWHASPEAVTQAYAAGARRLGAAVLTGSPVTGVVVEEGNVRSVVIERRTIETDTVVCAAGVWSPAIARTAGVELPVAPVLREVVTTAPVEAKSSSTIAVSVSVLASNCQSESRPGSFPSNGLPTLALGSVMKPSSDIEMWDVTLLIAPSYRISR